MRKLFFRILTGAAVLVLLVAAAGGGLLWWTLPSSDDRAEIAGLSAPVHITLDQDGIPRIQAATERDGAAALGYVHARDRMFQMEMMRRAAAGRLSEIAGPATVRLDRTMRTLGLARAAHADYAALPDDTKAMLQAYANGVNAWIAKRGRFAAMEFLPLGAPEPWSPEDSLLWAKTMGLYLSGNYRDELQRLALQAKLPRTMIDELWRGDPPRIHADAAPAPAIRAAEQLVRVLPRFPEPWTMPASASNEWAVDGAHSVTGAPILAGDPHLGFGFPGIWYLARIDTPDQTLVGATAPGVPFLVIGRNRDIAWTFTTTQADVQDVFIESANEPLTSREERIRVRGQPDDVLIVRESRHGPIISDIAGAKDILLAVSMANLQPGDTAAAGLLALNRARSVLDAGAAAPVIASPVQNLLVADRATIGRFTTGRVPIRRSGDGTAPVLGDGSFDWIGWASGEQLPHVVAPASGRLVNANERIAPPDFPVFLGRDWFGDWRARRIDALLDALPKASVADFARMQVDTTSVFAQDMLPKLHAVTPMFDGWNGAMTMTANQPLQFNRWLRGFHAQVMRYRGLEPVHGGPMEDFVAYVLSPEGAHWCGGDCTAMMRQAIDPLLKMESWDWGGIHQAVFANPALRGVPLLGRLATQTISVPGDDTTVYRSSPNAMMEAVHGASYRGVYDLADLDRSLFMIAPGQSGHPLRAHAGDMLHRWRDGATVTIGREPLSATEKIELRP